MNNISVRYLSVNYYIIVPLFTFCLKCLNFKTAISFSSILFWIIWSLTGSQIDWRTERCLDDTEVIPLCHHAYVSNTKIFMHDLRVQSRFSFNNVFLHVEAIAACLFTGASSELYLWFTSVQRGPKMEAWINFNGFWALFVCLFVFSRTTCAHAHPQGAVQNYIDTPSNILNLQDKQLFLL